MLFYIELIIALITSGFFLKPTYNYVKKHSLAKNKQEHRIIFATIVSTLIFIWIIYANIPNILANFRYAICFTGICNQTSTAPSDQKQKDIPPPPANIDSSCGNQVGGTHNTLNYKGDKC